jgi:hypothetical protein
MTAEASVFAVFFQNNAKTDASCCRGAVFFVFLPPK